MHNLDLLTTTEVAAALGISRQAVLQRVKSGALTPAAKLPGQTGTYLFEPEATCAAPAGTARS